MKQQTLHGGAEIIKSISQNQDEILRWIMTLYCPDGFELDPTYSKGNFYKKIKQPKHKFDLIPQTSDTKQADCRKLPLENSSINSIMFDPPFIVGIPTETAKTGIIGERFGRYKNMKELWEMYYDALKEFNRILKPNGILIFKCQDSVSEGKQWLSYIEIVNYALSLGFYPKDLFVLLARNRIIGKHHHKQQHARKFHSYFIVFIKQKSPVKYSEKITK
jgi:hypothetical protein